MTDFEYRCYDKIVANTLKYTIKYYQNNNVFKINKKLYLKFNNYYNSILKIFVSIYNNGEKPEIQFYDCGIIFKIKFLKQFKKYFKIKLISTKDKKKLWNPAENAKTESKFYNDIWKEYYKK